MKVIFYLLTVVEMILFMMFLMDPLIGAMKKILVSKQE